MPDRSGAAVSGASYRVPSRHCGTRQSRLRPVVPFSSSRKRRRPPGAAKWIGPVKPKYIPASRTVPAAVPIAIAALAMVIFVIDTVTRPEIAVAVFYIVVVLISAFFSHGRRVLLVSAGCMALTLLSYLLWPTVSVQAGSLTVAISLSAIGATGYLALRIK